MRPFLLSVAALYLFSSLSQAATKVDSILALTGGVRAKFVWARWPWCSADYTPVQAYSGVELESDNPFLQLVVFDSDEGIDRYLDSTVGSHSTPRITRKGTHVIWSDMVNNCSWIRDFAGAAPKRRFIDGDDFVVTACQWNSANNTEYVYLSNKASTNCHRVPLKADYTPDLANKVTIFQSTSTGFGPVSASEDGKYLGTESPWPQTGIWDVAANSLLTRHLSVDGFGCQPNIASDNSYRFFYLTDDHRLIRMWDEKLSATHWDVTINQGMPGNTRNHDCLAPRWTNSVRLFTNTYPLTSGFVQHWGKALIFGMTASQVKTADASNAGRFCLGRFSQDFKSVEKYALISDGDIRHNDGPGDAWIALSNDNTPPGVPANLRGSALSESKISLSWDESTDAESGILEYNLYRGNTLIAITSSRTYTDSLLKESTDYSYAVAAVNGANLASAKSSPVTVRTTADTRKPILTGVYALSEPTTVTVIFSEAVEKAGAETIANYQVSPGITISSASLSPDGTIGTLTLTAVLSPGTQYTLTVNNIKDTAATPNTILANSQLGFSHFPCGDGFNGNALDATRWTVIGSANGSVADTGGFLYIKAYGETRIGNNQFKGVQRRDITGDFDVWVKLLNSKVAPQATQQGIMMANNFSNLGQGGYAVLGVEFYNGGSVPINPDSYVLRYDAVAPAGQLEGVIESRTDVAFPCWLRLAKHGSTVTAYSSIVGPFAWREIGTVTLITPAANSQIGLYSASPSAQPWGSHAWFDEFGCTIDGLGADPSTAIDTPAPRMRRSPYPKVIVRGNVLEADLRGTYGSITLIDGSGRVLAASSKRGKAVIDLRKQPAGLYFVKISNGTKSSTHRVVIAR